MIILLFLATLYLAYNNGANDNFKGVATLYGSGVLSYRPALILATLTTFLGSVCAIFFAQSLVSSFSGKGLVPDEIAGTAHFLIAVGIGAGICVQLATRFGFPVSTTHSLVGGLVGAGIVAAGQGVNFDKLGDTFLFPLLLSPFLACALSVGCYWLLNRLRTGIGLTKETCICIGEEKQFVPVRKLTAMQLEATAGYEMQQQTSSHITIAETSDCMELYTDRVWGISAQKLLDFGHICSGAAVSFARGLNDTPKIAGLLLVSETLNMEFSMLFIALAMAIGGLLNARRVATMAAVWSRIRE
jgi:PiT family inorganic phosphate transporter